jgi:hypothetical protein
LVLLVLVEQVHLVTELLEELRLLVQSLAHRAGLEALARLVIERLGGLFQGDRRDSGQVVQEQTIQIQGLLKVNVLVAAVFLVVVAEQTVLLLLLTVLVLTEAAAVIETQQEQLPEAAAVVHLRLTATEQTVLLAA